MGKTALLKAKRPRTAAKGGSAGPAAVLFGALFLISSSGFAASTVGLSMVDMSFEELANIQVISVSKKAEPLADAPASVFVITGEDIRRSGATTLPHALRLAPNLQVAQINAYNYAISARGFNNSIGNKLLVLIDGRIVYTPLFSGVFWDSQDVMLEDVERIEVVSGPGGTLWGTNAVNGVINVITRSSEATQGGLVTAGVGDHGRETAFRYGGKLDNGMHYRAYGKYGDHDHTHAENGRPVRDAWNNKQAGFRTDWETAGQRLTFQGNTYTGDLEQFVGSGKVSGLNLLSRWESSLNDGSGISVLAYYDRTLRNFPGTYTEALNIFNAEFQHSLQSSGAHSIIWGASFRYSDDQIGNSRALAFLPANVHQKWSSLFAQDEIALAQNLHLILGARLERNDYTGLEFLPAVRLAWKPADNRLLWTGLSRTVRSPSRIDRDFYTPGQPPFVLRGNSSFRSEVANVFEVGYRTQPTRTLSYSVTLFHHEYDHLRTFDMPSPGSFVIGNGMEGSVSGIETWGAYQITPSWRLSAGLSLLKDRLRIKPGSTDALGTAAAGNDPAHAWQVRSTLNLARGKEFDVTVRRAGALPQPHVPAYTAVDARFGWRLGGGLDLSVTAQNLFGGRHPEFGSSINRSEVPSSLFVKLLWQI